MLGTKVARYVNETRSVIGEVGTTATGNVFLRVGREGDILHVGAGGWHQTEHVVLTLEEGLDLCEQVLSQIRQVARDAGANV